MMITIEKAIEDFIFHCNFEKRLSDKTIKAYSIDLEQFSSLMMCDFNLEGINQVGKDELKQFIQYASKFKPKTTKRKIATVKAMFNFLEFEDLLITNAFRKIRIRIKEPLILPTVMTLDEISSILRIAYDEIQLYSENKNRNAYIHRLRNLAVLELLFGTGVRVSELCSLKLSDFENGFTMVRVNGKGHKERHIHINNRSIKDSLKAYSRITGQKVDIQEYFFINRIGSRFSEQSVRFMVKKYAEKSKISKKITPHVFRHSFATLLLEQDVDIKYIQDILGHSSIMTTQIYTHVSTKKQFKILKNKHPRNSIKIEY